MVRKEYVLTDEQLTKLLDACKPTPVMYLSGGRRMRPSPQECANRAWRELAEELAFVWDTVRPVPSKGQKFFTAESMEEK